MSILFQSLKYEVSCCHKKLTTSLWQQEREDTLGVKFAGQTRLLQIIGNSHKGLKWLQIVGNIEKAFWGTTNGKQHHQRVCRPYKVRQQLWKAYKPTGHHTDVLKALQRFGPNSYFPNTFIFLACFLYFLLLTLLKWPTIRIIGLSLNDKPYFLLFLFA